MFDALLFANYMELRNCEIIVKSVREDILLYKRYVTPMARANNMVFCLTRPGYDFEAVTDINNDVMRLFSVFGF